MKKYQLNFLVFVFVFSLFFSVNDKASAISGACSYHDGVDCSVGADYDGSVICNDGWRDSSVGYYETSSCSSSNIPLCVSPSVYGCNIESDYSSRRALWARSGYPDTMLSNLQECRNQIDEYNRLKVEYDQCFYNLTHPTPYPIPVATPRPIPTPSYDPCPEGWINLRSLNLCINPQQSPSPTPIPAITASPTPTELFKDLFKNSPPASTPKPKTTPRITPSNPPKLTASPYINPESTTTIEPKKEVPTSNNTLTKIFKLFRKVKFW